MKNDRARWQEYARTLAGLMGLKDWEVATADEPPEEGANAQCRAPDLR